MFQQAIALVREIRFPLTSLSIGRCFSKKGEELGEGNSGDSEGIETKISALLTPKEHLILKLRSDGWLYIVRNVRFSIFSICLLW